MNTPTRAPGLGRRLACLTYESLLLFGVTMAAGMVYGVLTDQRHALVGTRGLQAFLLLVLAIYFVLFWSRSGQTLAMKTWRIRLTSADGSPPSQARALLRFCLSWIWLLPPLGAYELLGLRGLRPMSILALSWLFLYAASSLLRKDKQYWHDTMAGTRLVPVATQP